MGSTLKTRKRKKKGQIHNSDIVWNDPEVLSKAPSEVFKFLKSHAKSIEKHPYKPVEGREEEPISDDDTNHLKPRTSPPLSPTIFRNNRRQSHDSPLIAASIKGKVKVLQFLVSIGMRLDERYDGPIENALLHYAAFFGHIEMAKYLVENGAEVDSMTVDGLTPLHKACDRGHIKMVQFLVGTCKADISFCGDNRKEEAIHKACAAGNISIVEYLISMGATVKKQNTAGQTALLVALREGRSKMFKWLLKNGSDLNEKDYAGQLPIHVAANYGQLEMIKLLVKEFGVDPETKLPYTDIDALSLAAIQGYKDIVKWLMKRGAKVKSSEPMARCAMTGDLELSKILLESGASLTDTSSGNLLSPFLYACSKGQLGWVKWAVEAGKVDPFGQVSGRKKNNPLHYAAIGGHLQMAKWLINDIKFKPNCRNGTGHAPLHYAAECGHLEMIQLLVASGADINIQNVEGDTPLRSLFSGYLIKFSEIADWMIKRGAETQNLMALAFSRNLPLSFFKWAYFNGLTNDTSEHTSPLGWAITHSRLEAAKFFYEEAGFSFVDAFNPAVRELTFPSNKDPMFTWLLALGAIAEHPLDAPNSLLGITANVASH